MLSPSLCMDDKFLDCNFSSILDPTLQYRVSQDQLFEMAYNSRKGGAAEAMEFGDVMSWTLSEAAFECFQRLHGPRPIKYRQWFYDKLRQHLHILLYEELIVDGKAQTDRPWEEGLYIRAGIGPTVNRDEIGAAFTPEDAETFEWAVVVGILADAGSKRAAVLADFLAQRRQERSSIAAQPISDGSPDQCHRRAEWPKNKERNEIIRNCIARGYERRKICEELDHRTIPTLPVLQGHGTHKWVHGWDDPRLRNHIQQLLTKVIGLQRAVKS